MVLEEEIKTINKKDYPFLDTTTINLQNEVWKEIEGTQGTYEVSNLGRVKSVDRYAVNSLGRCFFREGKILKQSILKYPNKFRGDFVYELVVSISINNTKYRYAVHRLVYEAFVQKLSFLKDKLIVAPIDGDKFNTSVSNLKLITLNEKAKQIVLDKRALPIYVNQTIKSRKLIAISRQKQVSQYNLKGEKIAKYVSIKEAAGKNNIDASAIVAACKRIKMVTAGGFIWQYGNGPLRIDVTFYQQFLKKSRQKIQQPVSQFDKEGKLINTYNSIKEAAEKNKITHAAISGCINNKCLTSGGFIWKKGKHKKNLDIGLINTQLQRCKKFYPKPILQICPVTKQIIYKFQSVTEAAKKIANSPLHKLTNAAKKRNIIYNGFLWRFI